MINRFLKIFISAGMAITLLAILGGVLIFATVYESQQGTPAVQHLVYKTGWFLGLLGVIFLNVLFASLSRLPFKKEHTGFHITHIGLLTILFGSMLTCWVGVEGQLALTEGKSGDKITTETERVLFWREGDQKAHLLEQQFSKKINKSPWEKNILDNTVQVAIDGFSADSRFETYFEPVKEMGMPAVRVSLSGSFANETFWMVPGQSLAVGAATVTFDSIEDVGEFKKLLNVTPSKNTEKQDKGELLLSIPDKKIVATFPIEKILKGKQPILGTPYFIKGIQFYSHALVVENKLVNQSKEMVNPAVEFEIEGPEGTEKHVAFSLFPQFPSLHGQTSKNYEIAAHYVLETPPPTDPNALALYLGPNSEFICRITKKGETRATLVSLKNPVETGWMDLKFELKKFIPQALERERVLPIASGIGGGNPISALHFTFRNLKTLARSEIWLQKNSEAKLSLGDDRLHIQYGVKEIPLGFTVKLKDFVLKNYPGSERPMSYESFVEVTDAKKGKNFPSHIYMNHPLVYNGAKLFQASYSQNPGEPEVSIFSVKRDPGVPLIYGGSAILVVGIVILFFASPKTKGTGKLKKKKK